MSELLMTVYFADQKTQRQKSTKMGLKFPTSDQSIQIGLIFFWNVFKCNVHGRKVY